jgi:hypothetical protein
MINFGCLQNQSGKSGSLVFDTLQVPDLPDQKTGYLQNIPAGETSTDTAWRWLLHFADREPLEVTFTPAVSHGEVLEMYPAAVAAEPFTPAIQPPDASLSASDELTIRAWLADIGEADQSIVDVVVEQCQNDADARDYFLGRAGETQEEAQPVTWNEDDRRRCAHCLNLQVNGVCKVARGYKPNPAILQRCPGYRPCPDDPDRRTGPERWPEFQGVNL